MAAKRGLAHGLEAWRVAAARQVRGLCEAAGSGLRAKVPHHRRHRRSPLECCLALQQTLPHQ